MAGPLDSSLREFERHLTVEKNVSPHTVSAYLSSLYTIPFEMKQGGDALVIASGGGQEITMASHFGMKRIEAVEIARPIVTDILENRKNEPGNPYLLPNVFPHVADGRSVIMRSRSRYDIIQMLDVNFATVAGQISLAWSPNFVSTQEAFSEYLGHLKEDGFLCYTMFSRVRSPIAGEKGRRLASLVAGMKLAGIARPEEHLVILSRALSYGFQTLYLAKKSPFRPEELSAIDRIAASRGGRIAMVHPDAEKIAGGPEGLRLPGRDRMPWAGGYVVAVGEICRQTRPLLGIAAALRVPNGQDVPLSDDRPYLAGSGLTSKGRGAESPVSGLYTPLLKVLGVLIVLFLLLPFVVRRPGGGEKVKIDPRLVLILGLTGVGFMFLEMAGIYRYQLYLHHPTVAMIVVLSSMILGAGLGSLHSGAMRAGKQNAIALCSAGAALGGIVLFLAVPLWGHGVLLWLPLPALMPLVFAVFAGLGFLLGHVVPLSIDCYSHGQSHLLAWCWAITVTGSVLGTVLASILARDYGMFFVAALGILCYLGVAAVMVLGRAFGRGPKPDLEAAALLR